MCCLIGKLYSIFFQEASPELFLFCSAGDTEKAEHILISEAYINQLDEGNENRIDSRANTSDVYIFTCLQWIKPNVVIPRSCGAYQLVRTVEHALCWPRRIIEARPWQC